MPGTGHALARGREPGDAARRTGPCSQTPPNARAGRWLRPAVLATAGLAAAASGMVAAHAGGWIPLAPGRPLPLLGIAIFGAFAAIDAAIVVYLAACLLALQRPNPLGGTLSAALAAAPVALSAAKFAVLGSPAQFGDALLLGDLARATDPASAVAAAVLALAAALAFALNAERRVGPQRALVLLSPLVAAGALAAAAGHSPTLAARLAALTSHKISDIPVGGHVLNAYAELLVGLDRRHAVEEVLASGRPPPSALGHVRVPPLAKRNVH